MHDSLKKVLFATALLAPLSGCAALLIGGAAGAGGVAFLQGALQARLEAPLADSVRATRSATERLLFTTVNETVDALQAELIARDSVERRIEIKLRRETDGLTNISIRVGVFGDERASNVILDEIKKGLPTATSR